MSDESIDKSSLLVKRSEVPLPTNMRKLRPLGGFDEGCTGNKTISTQCNTKVCGGAKAKCKPCSTERPETFIGKKALADGYCNSGKCEEHGCAGEVYASNPDKPSCYDKFTGLGGVENKAAHAKYGCDGSQSGCGGDHVGNCYKHYNKSPKNCDHCNYGEGVTLSTCKSCGCSSNKHTMSYGCDDCGSCSAHHSYNQKYKDGAAVINAEAANSSYTTHDELFVKKHQLTVNLSKDFKENEFHSPQFYPVHPGHLNSHCVNLDGTVADGHCDKKHCINFTDHCKEDGHSHCNYSSDHPCNKPVCPVHSSSSHDSDYSPPDFDDDDYDEDGNIVPSTTPVSSAFDKLPPHIQGPWKAEYEAKAGGKCKSNGQHCRGEHSVTVPKHSHKKITFENKHGKLSLEHCAETGAATITDMSFVGTSSDSCPECKHDAYTHSDISRCGTAGCNCSETPATAREKIASQGKRNVVAGILGLHKAVKHELLTNQNIKTITLPVTNAQKKRQIDVTKVGAYLDQYMGKKAMEAATLDRYNRPTIDLTKVRGAIKPPTKFTRPTMQNPTTPVAKSTCDCGSNDHRTTPNSEDFNHTYHHTVPFYHGSSVAIKKIQPELFNKKVDNGFYGTGMYTTDKIGYAQRWGNYLHNFKFMPHAKVLSVHSDHHQTHPDVVEAVFNHAKKKRFPNKSDDELGSLRGGYGSAFSSGPNSPWVSAVNDYATAHGYDAVKWNRQGANADGGDAHEIVVKSPGSLILSKKYKRKVKTRMGEELGLAEWEDCMIDSDEYDGWNISKILPIKLRS